MSALAHNRDIVLDPITGVPDHVALKGAARAAIAIASRTKRPLSVAVVELTREPSEKVMRDRGIALALQAATRSGDQIFRLDDQLIVLLPTAEPAGVARMIERAARWCDGPLTWSCASVGADGWSLEVLLHFAGRRTYFSS